MARVLLPGVPVMRREFILKDLKTFFRDSTQWSQLILLGVLVAVYLINIRALPLFTGERVPRRRRRAQMAAAAPSTASESPMATG